MVPGATFEILKSGTSYYLICKDYLGAPVLVQGANELYLEFSPTENFDVVIMAEIF
jgi:hypothetical protein